jgi:hypothetical protein
MKFSHKKDLMAKKPDAPSIDEEKRSMPTARGDPLGTGLRTWEMTLILRGDGGYPNEK